MDVTDVKFRVIRDEFADAVAWVARSLPNRPSVAVLGGVLIDAGDQGVTVSTFDYEVSAEVTISGEVARDGRILVSGKLLADITRSLPNKPVDVEVNGTQVQITCGSARFTLPLMPVEEYPQLPAMPERTGSIPGDVFSEAVAQVAVAAGKDDTLPMLTGIRMEIEDATIVLAATDRFRLAVCTINWTPAEPGSHAVLVPAKTLVETGRSVDTHTAVDLSLGSDNLLGLVGSGRRTTTRLLDAQFPPFRNLLPSHHTAVGDVASPALIEAIKRVSLVAERGAQVRLSFTEGSVELSAGGEDAGRAEESLPARFYGEPLTIAFNPGYLLDGLGAIRSETVRFGFTLATRAAILVPTDGTAPEEADGKYLATTSDYIYLLMPVRLPG